MPTPSTPGSRSAFVSTSSTVPRSRSAGRHREAARANLGSGQLHLHRRPGDIRALESRPPAYGTGPRARHVCRHRELHLRVSLLDRSQLRRRELERRPADAHGNHPTRGRRDGALRLHEQRSSRGTFHHREADRAGPEPWAATPTPATWGTFTLSNPVRLSIRHRPSCPTRMSVTESSIFGSASLTRSQLRRRELERSTCRRARQPSDSRPARRCAASS